MLKELKKKSNKFNRNTDASSSTRVKVDKKTNSWHLRNINRNEYSDDINDKKLRWCASDSNPEQQDGRHRVIHSVMAAPYSSVCLVWN